MGCGGGLCCSGASHSPSSRIGVLKEGVLDGDYFDDIHSTALSVRPVARLV